MEKVLSDATLTPATYYYSFYVLEALRKAGLADRYLDRLGPWKDMLAMGLTTTAETPVNAIEMFEMFPTGMISLEAAASIMPHTGGR